MRAGLLLVMLGAARAAAQPVQHELAPEARKHLDAGRRYFDDKDYDAAIAEFRAGYAIDPDRDFLYAEAQAERVAGRCDAAIETFRAFLNTDPPRSQADVATYNIGRCQLELGKLPARSEPAAPVIAPPPAQPAEPTAWYADAFGITLGGAGVACTGVSAGLFVVAHRHARAADSPTATFGAFESEAQQADRDRTIGIVVGAAGAVLLAGSAVRFAIVQRHSISAAPVATAGGAGVSIVGAF